MVRHAHVMIFRCGFVNFGKLKYFILPSSLLAIILRHSDRSLVLQGLRTRHLGFCVELRRGVDHDALISFVSFWVSRKKRELF